jgi:hypothetical protein
MQRSSAMWRISVCRQLCNRAAGDGVQMVLLCCAAILPEQV